MKSGTVAACGPGLDAALTHYRITTTTRPLEDDEEDGAVERIKVLQSSQLDLMFANDAARAELAVTENNRPRSVLTGPDTWHSSHHVPVWIAFDVSVPGLEVNFDSLGVHLETLPRAAWELAGEDERAELRRLIAKRSGRLVQELSRKWRQ